MPACPARRTRSARASEAVRASGPPPSAVRRRSSTASAAYPPRSRSAKSASSGMTARSVWRSHSSIAANRSRSSSRSASSRALSRSARVPRRVTLTMVRSLAGCSANQRPSASRSSDPSRWCSPSTNRHVPTRSGVTCTALRGAGVPAPASSISTSRTLPASVSRYAVGSGAPAYQTRPVIPTSVVEWRSPSATYARRPSAIAASTGASRIRVSSSGSSPIGMTASTIPWPRRTRVTPGAGARAAYPGWSGSPRERFVIRGAPTISSPGRPGSSRGSVESRTTTFGGAASTNVGPRKTLVASSCSWLPGRRKTGTSIERSASHARSTVWRLTWFVSKTSPATTTNSAPCSRASAPIRTTASSRAWANRACASPSRKCRVMPSCQSAVWRNRTVTRRHPRTGPGTGPRSRSGRRPAPTASR